MDRGKAKPFSEGQHSGGRQNHSVRANIAGGGGCFTPPVYIFKKALWETSNVSEYVRNILLTYVRNIENHMHEYFRDSIS